MGSIIDLTRCDGCVHLDTPACVSACRAKNQSRFPEPDEKYLKDYWPQSFHEDWSNERDRTDRLTPYNWTFVERLEVPGEGTVFVPRRCMHCDDASCQKLCPFGTITKSEEGMVDIDPDFCMGGAKCRTTCPWHIPQRQAGLGLYTKLMPKLAGGGVLYKCDGCADRLAVDEKPACEIECPRDAITFAPIDSIKAEATRRAEAIGGHLYGMDEAGGTSTIYISKVPFEVIDRAIALDKAQKEDKRPGRPHMRVGVKSDLQSGGGLFMASVLAPIAGAAAAWIAVYKSHQKESTDA
jgi:Fe-S-cluster-containing dehydrogenase component